MALAALAVKYFGNAYFAMVTVHLLWMEAHMNCQLPANCMKSHLVCLLLCVFFPFPVLATLPVINRINLCAQRVVPVPWCQLLSSFYCKFSCGVDGQSLSLIFLFVCVWLEILLNNPHPRIHYDKCPETRLLKSHYLYCFVNSWMQVLLKFLILNQAYTFPVFT